MPSFNQRDYLVQAIRSIVDQGYPSLEFIVMDGGSTDGSVEVIRSFGDRIAAWVSEKDGGQSDAINKGLARCTGDVWAFVNSDDLLEPGALHAVGNFFSAHPEASWLAGAARVFGSGDEWFLRPSAPARRLAVLTPWHNHGKHVFPQSGACFMRRSVLGKIGLMDVDLHYSMDMEYYARAMFVGGFEMHVTDRVLAAWRLHPAAKTWLRGSAFGFREDEIAIAERYRPYLDDAERRELDAQLPACRQDLLLRKAGWHIREGKRLAAVPLLARMLCHDVHWCARRPWLGAVRRLLLGLPSREIVR